MRSSFLMDGVPEKTKDIPEFGANIIELLIKGKYYTGEVLYCNESGAFNPIIFGVEKKHLLVDIYHPNIVQFIGICFLNEDPVLIMEKMDTTLDSLLKTEQDFLKYPILLNVSRGLVYLHEKSIVHGNLTSHSVLVNVSTTFTCAKIADIKDVDKSSIEWVHYMPPEAQGKKPQYTTALDVFSFGHLALYTMNHVLPSDLLPPTHFTSKSHRELDRRNDYVNQLQNTLGSGHTVIQIIKLCLSDLKQDR